MEEPKAPKEGLVVTAMWMALLQAPLIYLVVGYFARKNSQAPAAGGAQTVLVAVFGVMAAVQAAVIFLVLPKFASKMKPIVFQLIRWALAEAMATYGLVLFFTGASWAVFLSFVGASLALLLALRPASS